MGLYIIKLFTASVILVVSAESMQHNSDGNTFHKWQARQVRYENCAILGQYRRGLTGELTDEPDLTASLLVTGSDLKTPRGLNSGAPRYKHTVW